MKTLDCRQQQCPHPVVEARKALLAAPGEPLEVLVGDETARENVGRMAASQGYRCEAAASEGGFRLRLTPAATAERRAEGSHAASGPTVVFVGSETLGQGDDELGRILMRNFLITLAESRALPASLLLVNSAVRFACAGADVLPALKALACNGVDVASCGLCLEYFDLKEALAVGRTTNMLEVVETLAAAGRVIRP